MDKTTLLKLFRDNLVKFFTILYDSYNESDFLLYKMMVNDIPIEETLIKFSSRILPHSSKVENEEEKFFLEGDGIFEGLTPGRVNYFRDLWIGPRITPEEKVNIWKWFKLFLKIAQKYSKL